MSYLVLARKWRPKTFADTVGQQHVRQALTNALTSGRIHHAYLFSGTRGVGKTTIARILAKALNCETGISAEPCGNCSACNEIDEGRFVDLIEVDAASRTRVDDTRELLDNVQYAPARGRFKVYLIDEVHMLSTHSFNALLKTLEEPPEHVKFLLATTDPQKLPVTVLSRCLQFNLTRLTPSLIRDRMAEICTAEAIKFDQPALDLLARAAAGSMRDGLSLLDQAIAFGAGEVREGDTRRILGTVDRREVIQLLEALAANDAQALMDLVVTVDQQFPNYARLLDELSGSLQRTAVFQVTGSYDSEVESDTDFIASLAEKMSPEDIQLFYQIALVGKRDLNLAPDPRGGFEMTLLRMLAFRPASSGAASIGGGSAVPVARPATGRSAAKRASVAKASEARQPVSHKNGASGEKQRDSAIPETIDARASASIPENPDWYRLVPELSLSGVERMLASNCAWAGVVENTIRLTLDARSATQFTEERRRAIEKALADKFDGSLSLSIQIGSEGETPAQRVNREQDETIQRAQQSIDQDPNVKVMREIFNAEIESGSVQPIE